MATTDTAVAQAARLIELIAWLSQRDSGSPVTYSAAGRRLGVPPDTVRRDLDVLVRLSDEYRPWLASLTVGLEATGFTIHSRGHYRRPFRLTPDEVLAIAIGLTGVRRGEAIAERFLKTLATERRPRDVHRQFVLGATPSPHVEQVLAYARQARDERRKLSVVYCGSDAEPGRRVVRPHQVVSAERAWYVYAWCETAGGWRLFRAERFLEVSVLSERFTPHAEFRPLERASELFRAAAPVTARVRFDPAIARWLHERYPGGSDSPRGYDVTFTVADPAWFVREILQYGDGAEVLEPESLREAVKSAVG